MIAMKPTLYSYCLKADAGAAPNPYWGVCTLVICKPAIRRNAEKGDWIVGLGSAADDESHHVVYATKVTDKMTMEQYDTYCRTHLPGKLPEFRSKEYKKRVGDCVYNYSRSKTPKIRPSVHDERNRESDLGGRYALISEYFWYFGSEPIELPRTLTAIAHPHVGHKSHANDAYVPGFIRWIESLGCARNTVHGEPHMKTEIMRVPDCRGVCAEPDWIEGENDKLCG
jgi:hypothetical protein